MKKLIILVIVLTAVALASAQPVNTLYESFDGNNTMPTGWTTIIESQNTAANVWVQTSAYDAYSGGNFIKMYGDTEADQDYLFLITPELTQVSSNTLSFFAKSSWGTESDTLRVGSITNPDDRETFTQVAAFQLTSEYQEFSVSFSTENSDSYIAFLHMPLGSVPYSAYIDDVAWESTNTAPNPAILIAPQDGDSDIGLNFLYHYLQYPLYWGASGGSPTDYILNFGSDYPPTNVVNNLSLGNVTEYSLPQELDYSTQYYWQIIPTNEFGQATDCPIWSFTTEPISEIDFNNIDEYSQGFEDGEIGGLPLGWMYENANDDTCWWEIVGNSEWSDNAHTGSQAIHMRFSFSNTHDDWLFSPAMNLIAENTYTISFWYKNSPFEDSIERMNLFVGDTPSSDGMYTQLWNNNDITNTQYQQAIVEYTPTETGVKHFAWHAYSEALQMILLLDDIHISEEEAVVNENNIVSLSDLSLSNYPNPFNPETIISFSIPKNETASLRIYNLKGQLVREFNELSSKDTQVVWNGTNNVNQDVPSGIYLTKLVVGDNNIVRKVTLLK